MQLFCLFYLFACRIGSNEHRNNIQDLFDTAGETDSVDSGEINGEPEVLPVPESEPDSQDSAQNDTSDTDNQSDTAVSGPVDIPNSTSFVIYDATSSCIEFTDTAERTDILSAETGWTFSFVLRDPVQDYPPQGGMFITFARGTSYLGIESYPDGTHKLLSCMNQNNCDSHNISEGPVFEPNDRLTFVYKNQTLHFFVNENHIGVASFSDLFNDTETLRFGCLNESSEKVFKGGLDTLVLFNVGFSSNDVSSLSTASDPQVWIEQFGGGPQAYWNLGEGADLGNDQIEINDSVRDLHGIGTDLLIEFGIQ